MNHITGTTAAALDQLHPDRPGRTPRLGTDADRLTCAGLALAAIMRVVPDGLRVRDAGIQPQNGTLTLYVEDYPVAEQLAARLGLRAAFRVVELDDGWLCWSGTWAGWPVTVLHQYRAGDDDAALAAGSAAVAGAR